MRMDNIIKSKLKNLRSPISNKPNVEGYNWNWEKKNIDWKKKQRKKNIISMNNVFARRGALNPIHNKFNIERYN